SVRLIADGPQYRLHKGSACLSYISKWVRPFPRARRRLAPPRTTLVWTTQVVNSSRAQRLRCLRFFRVVRERLLFLPCRERSSSLANHRTDRYGDGQECSIYEARKEK